MKSHFDLILVPALISLAVTLLRLAGELLDGPDLLFNPTAPGALVGISWLPPVFGVYFALKLARSGEISSPGGRVAGFSCLGLIFVLAALTISTNLVTTFSWIFSLTTGAFLVAVVYLMHKIDRALFSTLIAYGLAARIPVALLMLVAMIGDWGTHYDIAPVADFPEMSVLSKWVAVGLLPQLTFWMAYTVILGGLFGGVALLFVSRR